MRCAGRRDKPAVLVTGVFLLLCAAALGWLAAISPPPETRPGPRLPLVDGSRLI